MHYFGIDKGGTRHTLALADERGEVIQRVQHDTDRYAGARVELESLQRDAGLLLDEARAFGSSVQAIGISFGGPVDVKTGSTLLSHHVEGWEGVPLRHLFEEWFGLPTAIDNDANVGALGEWKFGAGVGCWDMVYINVGTGIGGGVIANGQVVRGTNNLAGEIGHTTIDPSGPVCTCGRRGCLESFASGPAIERRFRERFLSEGLEPVGCREIFSKAAAGDADATATVVEAADYLARGIGASVSLLNPELVVLGGGLSETGELLFGPINEFLPRYILPQATGVRVVPAVLGYDAGVRGAIALAMEAAPKVS